MSDNSAQQWVDDLTGPSDDEQETESSLFEENFRKMVEDGDLDDITVSTLESQVERIDDPELLADALDADSRTTAESVYKDRIATINEERHNDSNDTDDTDDAAGVGDQGEPAQDSEAEPEEEAEATQSGGEGVGGDTSGEAAGAGVTEEVNDETAGSPMAESIAEDVEGDLPDDPPSESVAEADDDTSDAEKVEDPNHSPEPEPSGEQTEAADGGTGGDLPDVDVSSLAPDAIPREEAASQQKNRTMLVWGPEGSGKSHVAHSAPEPICYIDTEGKADELAGKFDKTIHYWVADDFKQAKSAMEQALDVLGEYLDAGVRGTLVVDSMTAMWEYAKVDYAKFAYQTDDLVDVSFQSELEGEQDWTKIKARHNESFREEILASPFHVVMTSGQKEAYYSDEEWVPDGEKWNKYAVKDVVQLRRDDEGKTVADLRKAARTRYSFVGLEWPTWDAVYDAVDEIYEAEQADTAIDVTDWPFSVIDGQPVGDTEADDNGGDGDE